MTVDFTPTYVVQGVLYGCFIIQKTNMSYAMMTQISNNMNGTLCDYETGDVSKVLTTGAKIISNGATAYGRNNITKQDLLADNDKIV